MAACLARRVHTLQSSAGVDLVDPGSRFFCLDYGLDPIPSDHQCAEHVEPLGASTAKHEHASTCFNDSPSLGWALSDTAIPGYKDRSTARSLSDPFFVGDGPLGIELVVDLDIYTYLPQCKRNTLADRSIEEEHELGCDSGLLLPSQRLLNGVGVDREVLCDDTDVFARLETFKDDFGP